jgi:hypothetical protein
MLVATAIAIFIIPVLFVLVERLASRRAEATGLVGEPVASEGGAL